MKKEVKVLAVIAAVVLVGGVMALQAFKHTAPPPSDIPNASGREELIRPDSPSFGEGASVTVVEFLDPECEACAAYFPRMKAALTKYQGKIRFVVRYMAFHGSSELAIAAVEAAGKQGRYWEMLDQLFEKAGEWGHQPTPRQDLMVQYAANLSLDETRFAADLEDPQVKAKIERDVADAKALGVKGTPTIFVNGIALPDLSSETLDASLARAFTGG